MGRKALYGLAVGIIVAVLILSVDAYADRKAEETVKNLISRFRLEKGTSYSEVDYSVLRGETLIRDLSFRTEKGRVRVDRVVVEKLTEEETRVRFLGITSTDPDFRKFQENMRELGYEEVKADLTVDVLMDRRRGDLTVRKMRLEVPEAFSVNLSLDLGSFFPDLLEEIEEEDLEEFSERLGRVRIKSFEISLEDLGIRERVMRKEAKEKGKDPEEIKEEILRELEETVKESDPKIKKDLVAKIRSFVKEGGTIRLVAEPETPVRVSDLILVLLVSSQTRDISQVVDMLSLRVDHER